MSEVFHTDRTLVMGILNVTPDSFSDGGEWARAQDAIDHALRMVELGADIVDVGGESTRPGAPEVDAEEELRRVLPVVEGILAANPSVVVSIDTTKASVARAALEAGARIVNDVSACRFDEAMASVAAEHDATVVLMHMQGTPRTMQDAPRYDDVVADVVAFLEERIAAAIDAGVDARRIVVDPGIGFGKTLEHNLELLRRLDELAVLECPILLGTSRKSFIGRITGRPARERAFGTAATVALGIAAGVRCVRVHDVAEMVDVVRTADAIVRGVVR